MKNRVINFRMSKKTQGRVLTLALVLFAFTPVFAAGAKGASAISTAADTIAEYRDQVEKVIYAIAGVVGFIGAVRIFNKWQNGDQDINKEIMGWAGAFVFLVVAPSFIKAFFN